MSEKRCDLTELLVDQCDHCRPKPASAAVAQHRIVATWEARYYGRCGWCDGKIEPGDVMGRDEHDTYVCQQCVED